MIKIILSIIFVLGIIGCKSSTELSEYYGQSHPETTPIIFAPGIISIKGRIEHGISFSPDTRELVFGILNTDDNSGKIHYSKKVQDNWTEPIVFEPLKNKSVYLPYFSPNGKSILFAQTKPETNDGYTTDIWSIEKSNGNWSFHKKVQAPVSSISREANASMTYDGTIYFSSNRNCLGKENCFSADLFYSKKTIEGYNSVNVVPEFISPNDEESVFISPNEAYILFCRYTNNTSFTDLYISYRNIDNNWTEPQLLDSAINSKDWDRRPYVSIDDKLLFFTRLQIEENNIVESDIYWVNTTKVFKPFVYNPLSNKTLQVGQQFKLSIPKDYFKDIDGEQLTLSSNQDEFDWLEFDSKKMTVSGIPTLEGEFELTFTAQDKSSNITVDSLKITVSI